MAKNLPADFNPFFYAGDDETGLRIDGLFVVSHYRPRWQEMYREISKTFAAATSLELSVVVTNDYPDARKNFPVSVITVLHPELMADDADSLDEALPGELTAATTERHILNIDGHDRRQSNGFTQLSGHPAWKTSKCYLRHTWLKNQDGTGKPHSFRVAVLDVMG